MEFVLYEAKDKIAAITLNRPEARNAQNKQLLDELDACWTQAAQDDEVRVIVLKANGPHFSSGHDISVKPGEKPPADFKSRGLEAIFHFERVHFLGYSRKWRDVPKPSIAPCRGPALPAGSCSAGPAT